MWPGPLSIFERVCGLFHIVALFDGNLLKMSDVQVWDWLYLFIPSSGSHTIIPLKTPRTDNTAALKGAEWLHWLHCLSLQ